MYDGFRLQAKLQSDYLSPMSLLTKRQRKHGRWTIGTSIQSVLHMSSSSGMTPHLSHRCVERKGERQTGCWETSQRLLGLGYAQQHKGIDT